MHDLISAAMTAEEFELIHEGTFYAFSSTADMEPAPPPPIAEVPPETGPIQTVEELLRALRDNMPSAVHSDLYGDPFVAIINPNLLTTVQSVIGFVTPESPAARLLDDAHLADVSSDIQAIKKLPIRHGPYCGMWVLADAPYAPGASYSR
jgi:hypothetical protein